MSRNLLQTSAAWLGEQLQEHCSWRVDITQDTTVISGLKATLVIAEHEVVGEEGYLVRVESYDWTFVAKDLTRANSSFVLRSGAQILHTDCGKTTRYEVAPLSETKPAVQFLDAGGVMLTVHTKKVGA